MPLAPWLSIRARQYFMLRNAASEPEIGLPGRISAGFHLESIKIGPPAGLRLAGGPILKLRV